MAEQAPSSSGAVPVVVSAIGTPVSRIVTTVTPQMVVQSPQQQQQQVLILPTGAATIPPSQLSQIAIRQQPAQQNNIQMLSQQTPVQVINQSAGGQVTIVSQSPPGSTSQMFYIVSPTRTVTTAKPQGVISGNKVLLSPTPSGIAPLNVKSQSPVIQAVPSQSTVVLKSPQNLATVQNLQQSQNMGTLVANSTQNSGAGITATLPTARGLQTVVSQGTPLLTTQGTSRTTAGIIPTPASSVVAGQNKVGTQPVTLQLKITDTALLKKLGIQQGKVLNLSGMNLNNLLANHKVQLVGQPQTVTSASPGGALLQSATGQNVKLASKTPAVLPTVAGNSLASLAKTNLSLPQTSAALKVVSTVPITTVTTAVTTAISTVTQAQLTPVASNRKGQQQIVMMKPQPSSLASSQPSPALSVVGTPQAGPKPIIVSGGEKIATSGASFVIGNRQISNIAQQASIQKTGITNSVQKRITLSPSKTSNKKLGQTLILKTPTHIVKTEQKGTVIPPVVTQAVKKSGISAVNAGLKAAVSDLGSVVPSSTNAVVTSASAGPLQNTNSKKETVLIKKFDVPPVKLIAGTGAPSLSGSAIKPTTTASSTGSQSYVNKFIRIVPPKPGQKQTQMVISVNPNTDVNGEVREISNELAVLQAQPKTHDTLKKLQDLQTRLQQLQMVTQLIKKAKMNQQSAAGSSPNIPGVAAGPDTKERKKIIKQHKLQEKANRIVQEAVQKAKAAGKVDIPNVNNLKLPVLPAGVGAELDLEEERRKKKKDKSKSKSKKKDSKKDRKKDKEKKQHPPKKKIPKKLPAAAILKLKRQKRKRGEDCSDSSDFDETPPRSPGKVSADQDGELWQRRSARNTTRKKYTEDYDFKITDDESSSSSDDDNEGKEKKDKKKERKKTAATPARPGPPAPAKSVLVNSKPAGEVDSAAEVDVESVEPVLASQGTQFFVENPDEDEANIIEKILAYRSKKKPPLPGEAQVGELEEFFVKYKNFSYLHCEWQTVDKIKDPRIHQKVKRFKQKLRHMTPIAVQQMEEEPFNPDFIQVDRVLDEAVTKEESGDEVTHYLVKWASLPYEDSTWELSTDVEGAKVQFFHKFREPPPSKKRVRKSRARASDWEKMSESPKYKDGNKLRDYQLEGVNWLMFSWCNGQNCILADEMGLGKTIQSIGFLMEMIKFGIVGPFLVIAPLSTITNWQREFEAWTDLNAVVYHGSAQSRHMIAEFEMFYKDENGAKIPNCFKFHVLITTYEILLADCQELSEIEWRAVIIDEAHRLKNRNCKLLEGLRILDVEHRVLLTGTPLQNNVEELFSLLNFLEPGRFRSLVQFMDDFGDLKTESQVERLQQLLKPMMLRRLKEDVEKNLAPKEETIVEVELTSIQKRYYRAILERNFSFLQKGANTTNLPNLMNTMMELRKCCNHPFLINGAEDQIMLEMNNQADQTWVEPIHLRALTQSSGKMVLLDKLLPKLKEGGHRVLIFSQMIRCLDILEDYLLQKRYLFERIDGRVRGNLRQAAIDRFSKPDSDRFIFLLCTRAGGLGINLTAADTCIIFDSDWNPQNDLQAQARCHRIGQQKAVKIYRLITRNSYEREMFDKASMKLGLDKAVLQSMRADKDAVSAQQPLTKMEVEDLLRKGAYGAIMEDDESSSKFCEEDIEMILKRRTKVIQIESGVKGSTFAKASFTVASDHADIKIDDPDFWQKWAKKADIQIRDAKEEKIIMAPRQRKQTRRYGGDHVTELTSSDEEVAPPKEEKPSKKQLQSGWTRLECFRVEKGLLTFGWGCWSEILSTTRFRRRLGEKDIEAISRTMLIYCLQYYKGDENIKGFIWDLVTPSQDGTPKDVKQHKGLSVLVPRGGRKSKKPKKEEAVVPCILEFDFNSKDKNAEQLLNDVGYKNHLKRHCNKVLLRVRLLFYLRHEIMGQMARRVEEGALASDLELYIPPPEGEKPIGWWDTECDKSLLIGVFKHGYEKYHRMRMDPCLCFLDRCGMPRLDEMPAHSQDGDGMLNDSQLDVEAMEQDSSSVPRHLKEEAEMDSPGSTRPSSPATQNPGRRKLAPMAPSEPGKLPFPQAPDLNTRVRRLVAGFQREQKKKQLKEAKKEKQIQREQRKKLLREAEREKKDKVKKMKIQEQLRQREMRKVEGAQKWSRREESDFYRILAAFGVEVDMDTGEFNWKNFKRLAKLERKYDHRMQEFYEHYRVMCLRVCKREDEIPADYAERPPLDFQIEPISEERASKCLQRIDLLLKVRTEVLPHPELEERLQLCQKSVELPEWWEPGMHDKDLLVGVSRYGINRMESQQMMMNDQELSFKELKKRYPQMGVPPPGAFTSKPKGEGKKKKKPAKPKNPAKTEKQEGGLSSQNADTPAQSQEQKHALVGQEGLTDKTAEAQGKMVSSGDSINLVELKKPPPVTVKTETMAPSEQASSEVGVKTVEGSPLVMVIKKEQTQKGVSVVGAHMKSEPREAGAEAMPDTTGNALFNAMKTKDLQDGSQDKDQFIWEMQQNIKLGVTNPEHVTNNVDGVNVEGALNLTQVKQEANVGEVKAVDSVTAGMVDGNGQPEMSKSGAVGDGGNGGAEESAAKPMNGEGVAKAGPAKQMSEAEILYTYILRWPKDRVIVHRLEQISTCVLKGVWPGRRHNPPPPPPPPDAAMTGTDWPPMEHSYAGGFMGSQYMEMDEPVPMKKKKKKRKPVAPEHETEPRSDSASYEVYRLLVGADSQGDGDLIKKRKRKEGSLEPEMGQGEVDGKPARKRKRKEKLKAIDPLTGLPLVPEELIQVQEEVMSAPSPKRRRRLKDPATLDINEITGEEKVGIIEKFSGYVLPAKRVPQLKDVAEYIMKHPRYLIAYEWGEIVIKKGFIPPQLYDRISNVPSHQKHLPAVYQTRAASSTNEAGPQVPAMSVPLAPSVAFPSKPSALLEHNRKVKKKLKEKVTAGIASSSAGSIAPPVVPSQLSGISSYLIPSSGGVFISPYLASQRMVQQPGSVEALRQNKGDMRDTAGSFDISGNAIGAEVTAQDDGVEEAQEVVGDMEGVEDDQRSEELGVQDGEDQGNESNDNDDDGSDDSSSIDDNDYNMLMNSDVEGLQDSDDEDMSDDDRDNDGEFNNDEQLQDVRERHSDEDEENQSEDDDDDDEEDDTYGDQIKKYEVDDDDDDDDDEEQIGDDDEEDDDDQNDGGADSDDYYNDVDEADPFREEEGDDEDKVGESDGQYSDDSDDD